MKFVIKFMINFQMYVQFKYNPISNIIKCPDAIIPNRVER